MPHLEQMKSALPFFSANKLTKENFNNSRLMSLCSSSSSELSDNSPKKTPKRNESPMSIGPQFSELK